MGTHTPGQWFVDKDQSDFVVSSDFGQEILRCLSADDFPCLEEGTEEQMDEEARANTRLCAAAPELLAELKELYAVVRGECPSLLNEDSGGNAEQDARILAAIAKAEVEPA